MLLRRKRLPDELQAAHASFERVLAEIEPAKEALTEVMPTTRLPGRPLPDALAEFEDRLRSAALVMPAWRRDETESVWTECDGGIAEALERAGDGTDAIYVTVDVDAIDHAQAPGTAAPNPNGLDARDLYRALRRIARRTDTVGLDVVEISPSLEHGNLTANLGAMLVLSFLAGVAER